MRRRDVAAAAAFFAARRHVKVRLKSARESESASWISEDAFGVKVGDFRASDAMINLTSETLYIKCD